MNTKVRDWYIANFPTDDCGKRIRGSITFKDVYERLKTGECIYSFLGVYDSMVREIVFDRLSEVMNVDYDDIYNLWIYPNNNKQEE